MIADRRQFLSATGSAFAAFAAAGCAARAAGGLAALPAADAYGALVPDPAAILDLPPGFSYRVLSTLGDAMTDGGTVPDRADGMGCFDIGNGELALVRNHELNAIADSGGANGPAYDTVARSLVPLAGGTTTLVIDAATLAVKRQYRSLAGTIRNCAGGVTPWGSWLSCEENVSRADGQINRDHGYVFEVPANAERQVIPVALTAMGRFNHEAAVVDPASGIVYLTEDRPDSLLYRFIPAIPGQLAAGGQLQALAAEGVADSRNWENRQIAVGQAVACRWIDLDNVEAPEDDLRQRGAAQGATLFARGEGIWMGEGEFYFTCTSGGPGRFGQIFRLRPASNANGADMLDLFFESASGDDFTYGDNLTIAPDGHLIVCEDRSGNQVNYIRGVTTAGGVYPFARLRVETEPAGVCFSPDGATLFVNLMEPTRTLAITGPWNWG
ncbi:alkaline phosphatase PhoX [Altererythrobacter lauratis]|uniref:Alkaline phosphatase PhoX n=1 Tax=Alteraurantiacibacter lauratis TaxID=2054627 RepID=A0ABV7EGY2_9SPHN